MADETTDSRLIGCTPYMSEEALSGETHAHIRTMLKNDFAEFLQSPTHNSLRVVVDQLLSYQDSFLLGTRRHLRKGK